ncbi:MAG: acyl--CoA ligase [Acidimicrobiales bacterium]|nr:acyl--CoA ligase [Acidimicrobiales bacterium]
MGPGLLIADIFANAARAVPGRVAVALGDRTLTYGELDADANRVAHALAGLGVRRGDRVVTWSDNSIEHAVVFAALAKLGAAFAPANARLGPDEATEMVALARPRLLVVDPDHAGPGEDVAARLDLPLLRTGGAGPGIDLVALAANASAADATDPSLDETDAHVVFFTSGSTGRSKGVVLSNRVNWLRSRGPVLLEPRGATVSPYPMFHMGAWTLALQAWQCRQACVFLDRAEADLLLDAVHRHRASHVNCIPGVWQRVLDADRSSYDLSCLRIVDSGTSATPPELLAALRDAFPQAARRVFYGSTEAGPVTMLAHEDMERKPNSCGIAHTSVELDFADGEMLVRSPLLFDHYFDDPGATAEVLDTDGWFHTGDVADLDDEGFVSIVGRAKDIIRSGGESVSPSEVEAALADHPGIADVAVVGVPDVRWGEVVCAAVVPADPKAPPTLEELQAHVAGRLARYKQPRRVEVIDEVPRTPATNQVQRRRIIAALAERG